jgi:MYXO-CTERM domain-containing protein
MWRWVAGALALGGSGEAWAATKTVCPAACDYSSIAAAMVGASAGDTLSLTASSYSESNPLTFTKNLTIQGATGSPTIHGVLAGSPLFNLQSGKSATLRSVTLDAAGVQRAITTGGDLHLETVTVGPVTGSNPGLAVNATGGTLTITGSTFTSLSASAYSGAAINLSGGTIADISSSTFTGCTANYGGAVYLSGSTTTLAVHGSTFSGGTARSGGAIDADLAGNLAIDGSTFENNQSSSGTNQDGGGALLINDTPFTMTDSIVRGNSSSRWGGALRVDGTRSFLVTGTLFDTNTSSDSAGALYLSPNNGGPVLTLTSDTFQDNVASQAGGAVYVESTSNLMIDGCVFNGNSTGNDRGGALYATNGTTSTSISRSRFCKNTAGKQGGALNISAGSLTVTNSAFVDNSTTTDTGGAITVQNAATLRNLVVVDTSSSGSNGAIYSSSCCSAFSLTSSIIAFTDSGNGARSGIAGTVRYDDWYQNVNSDYNNPLDATNKVGVDPKLFAFDPANPSCGADLRIRYTSPLRNAGDSSQSDLDNTTADIGMYGGPGAEVAAWVDADGDSYPWVYDCDDANTALNPGKTEIACDGIDQDCNGLVDDGTSTTLYRDADGDGYGNSAGPTVQACSQSGYVANSTDCNDSNAAANPGAQEICDPLNVDEDCDNLADDSDPSATGKTTWYADSDADGYGAGSGVTRCDGSAGQVAVAGDCDDANAARNPGAAEICDPTNIDQDCDGLADDADSSATGKTSYYADGDGDGYGAGAAIPRCDPVAGQVTVNGDCNDANVTIKPGGQEICDASNVDEDCDGVADDADPTATGKTSWYTDGDGDTYGAGAAIQACDAAGRSALNTDCNDSNAAIHPGGQEVCDASNVDEDCDGTADDADLSTAAAGKINVYGDGDGDGFGAGTAVVRCDVGAGQSANNTDCDDAVATIHPGGTEICNSKDDDCDSQIDEGAGSTFYRDVDADGYGIATTTTVSCTLPAGYASIAGDCDDAVATTHPNASELCNGADDDCDSLVDENVKTTWYRDADTDGYGTTATTTQACTAPAGYVAASTDCDDTRSNVHPNAPEICDSRDNDCDGATDEGVTATFYADADADGYGNAAVPTVACSAPANTVTNATDCDDTKVAVNPAATEICNGIDDDCDAQIDEGVRITYYADFDADGYGDLATTAAACTRPSGFVADATDCDDTLATVHPLATEVCNGRDDDCDGLTDEAGATVWHADADGDSYGDATVSVTACTAPNGYVADGTDCNDADGTAFPGAPEACDGVDDDCDGAIDDNTTPVTWYLDADGDGDGGATTLTACAQPNGYVGTGTDCDDADPTVRPGVPETCDGVDEDCDGAIDDSPTDGSTYYADDDADGFGDVASPFVTCSAPTGYVTDATDCDDTASAAYPGATETCDGTDEDCDGTVDNDVTFRTWFADVDGDGYGDPASGVNACARPAGSVATGTDCDDGNPSRHPNAVEVCDGIDQDCDGQLDDNASDATPWFADADGDGFGELAAGVRACTAPAGSVATSSDCDDAVATVHPGATELCNGIDDDCDGNVDGNAIDAGTYYDDADGDGHGDPASPVVACSPPAGAVGDASDCDDGSALVYTGAAELCDGVDNDCNAAIDDNVVSVSWYADADGDGVGDDAVTQITCSIPPGYVRAGGDCDDTDAGRHPGLAEICDNVDQDCDGIADDGLTATWYPDGDGDGFGDASAGALTCSPATGSVQVGGDCDDAELYANPDMPELSCDGFDNDCDGTVDEGNISVTWFADADGDGLGDAGTATAACAHPAGTVLNDDDCDDTEPSIGLPSAFHVDADGDGFGVAPVGQIACVAPAGMVADATDCDDTDATVFPGAPEWCDLRDNDCTGVAEDDAPDTTFYGDYDLDGYGTAADTYVGCAPFDVYVAATDDCDDSDATVHPNAVEACDGADQDCDGVIDEGALTVFHVDLDGDGFGDPDATALACDVSDGGLSAEGTDCDDDDPDAYPDAPELCNGIDDDCDGTTDDGLAPTTFYVDDDGDGYGDVEVLACVAPSGTVAVGGDCDDSDPAVSPDAVELCNDADDNCDDLVDNDVQVVVWHPDLDADGFGDPDAAAVSACDTPEGDWSTNDQDCDDTDPDVNPDADDVPYDGIDQDCDGDDLVDVDGDGHDGPDAITGDDCDDEDPTAYVGAEELVDDVDQDCDGYTDPAVDDFKLACGCASEGPVAPWAALAVLAGLAARRRRSA